MKVSNLDIKARIERILSDIFSDKYDANITIRFTKERRDEHSNTSSIIE